jgi:hypothetical protein
MNKRKETGVILILLVATLSVGIVGLYVHNIPPAVTWNLRGPEEGASPFDPSELYQTPFHLMRRVYTLELENTSGRTITNVSVECEFYAGVQGFRIWGFRYCDGSKIDSTEAPEYRTRDGLIGPIPSMTPHQKVCIKIQTGTVLISSNIVAASAGFNLKQKIRHP